jgi:hypothetical protein
MEVKPKPSFEFIQDMKKITKNGTRTKRSEDLSSLGDGDTETGTLEMIVVEN